MLKLEKMSVFKLLIYDIRLSPELLLPYMGPESESSLRSRYFRKCHMNFKLLPRNFHTSSLLKQNSVVKFVDKVNPFQDGSFSCCLRMGAKSPLPPPPPAPPTHTHTHTHTQLTKICHTYPTMIKLGTVITYLKKIQKICKSRGTPLEFCWH